MAVSDTTETADDVMIDPVTGEIIDQKELAERLLAQAREQGVSLVGPGGLLGQLTASVLETALEAEMTEHLGHEHGGTPAGTNMRNGLRTKTVLTEIGPVEIEVPRDRDGTFEPVIVPKRRRRLEGIDQIVLSLTARGLTTGEVSAHFEDVYGARVSKDTISRITEKVTGELAEWSSRPLDPLYPVIFVDAIVVKVRDGSPTARGCPQVRNTPFYVVMGVTVNGERDILGIWAGDGAEGARFWLQVFSELKNRGVDDVLIAVYDGLKGLPDAINTTWEHTVVQQCIVHLIRNSFRYAGRQHRDAIVKSLKPVYTAPSEQAAKDRFAEFAAEWGERYPAIVQLWRNSWAEFVPFLEYDVEIRRVICTTNAIESINARYRRAVRARGHFPNEQAALKCLYLVTRSLDPTGGGRARWMIRWKPALNAFAITFQGRFEKTNQ
jgi:transposase-like protein